MHEILIFLVSKIFHLNTVLKIMLVGVCVCGGSQCLTPLREGRNCGYGQGEWGPVPWRAVDGQCALGYGIP
jgi:hypothetical protein